ncbi:MAG: YhcH/YjgK/YiaL family protein [Chloroflexi bacterium]|nr:YhcH/YjgK/YiaL family protein [Chloroflexota bacterium]
MIITDLEHAHEQIAPTPSFEKALAFLRRNDLATLPDGNIEIDGKRVFAMVQSYETFASDAPFKFEAHRAYIDIQYIVAGAESIGWTPTECIAFNTPYDSTNDIHFGVAPTESMMTVSLQQGQLAVFYPSDGHAPRHSFGAVMPVKKIVVKVAV